MKDYEDNWEREINALLDGELNGLDADELKAAAKDNTELASRIVDAYQLQQTIAGLPQDRAPASLTKRLLAIPAEQHAGWPEKHGEADKPAKRPAWLQPRWVMALAAVPLAIIAVNLMQPKEPSAAEIAQARHDLAIAFAYLDKAGRITRREIENQVGNTMTDAIAGSVLNSVKSQYELSKENNT